jgi:hypothetical protein
MMVQIAAEWAGSECLPAVPELDFSAATTPDPDVSAQLVALSEADQADRSGDMPLDIATRDQAHIRSEIPHLTFVMLKTLLVAGAVLLAMRRDGLPDEALAVARERLLADSSSHEPPTENRIA